MLELLKRINREKFDITCCFTVTTAGPKGKPSAVLNSIGIPLIVILNISSPHGRRLPKNWDVACCFLPQRPEGIYTSC